MRADCSHDATAPLDGKDGAPNASAGLSRAASLGSAWLYVAAAACSATPTATTSMVITAAPTVTTVPPFGSLSVLVSDREGALVGAENPGVFVGAPRWRGG